MNETLLRKVMSCESTLPRLTELAMVCEACYIPYNLYSFHQKVK